MFNRLQSVIDGAVTAGVITGIALLIGNQLSMSTEIVGVLIFYLSGVLLAGSIVVTAAGRRSPPGVLGAMRGRPARPPSPVPGRDAWFDRFATLDNAWLIAAFMLFAISLMPPFLGLE